MDEARASVHAECTPPMSWPLLRVRMLINFLCMYLILLKSAVHQHGQGRALVHALCSSSVSCVPWPQLHASMLKNDLFLISLHLLCTGMDEARALVRPLCNSSVSPMSSPLLHA